MSGMDWLTYEPQLATIVAVVFTGLSLSFTGYVWWATNRDKRILALRRIIGELNYVCVKKANFNKLSSEQKIDKLQKLQEIYEKVADGIAVALKLGGGNISNRLGVEATKFTGALYLLSQHTFRRNKAGLDESDKESDSLYTGELRDFTSLYALRLKVISSDIFREIF